MAKSSKTKTGKPSVETDVVDSIEDGVPTSDNITESDDITDATDMTGQDMDAAFDDSDPDTTVEADAHDDLELETIPDTDQDDVTAYEAPIPDQPSNDVSPEQKSSSVFFPMLLGGIAVGAIGYGIATYFPMNDTALTDELAVQTDQITALDDRISAIPIPDLSAIEAQIAAIEENTASQISALSDSMTAQLSALDERLIEVEKRPGADGTLSETALNAYQNELENLRAELDAQQATVMSAATQAEADLAAARAEAAALEQEALAAAQSAAARAALNRVATAVETGVPFADALSDIGGGDLPAALVNAAETGVATTAQLVQEFPAAARAALATARAEGVSDDAGGIGGFLRSQFDVRSTAPKEGAGPDAVLSRAEAAIKEGRVADALAEIEALPEVARAELTDWTARASERADVLDAIATLSETYN